MKKRLTDRFGYFTFTLIGSLVAITGILMNVFDVSSSYDGLKYDTGDKLPISGNLVIILGVIVLAGVLVFYLADHRKKADR